MKTFLWVLSLLLGTVVSGFTEEFQVSFDRLETGKYVLTYEEHYYDGVGDSILTIRKYGRGYRAAWEGITDNSEVYTDNNFNTYRMIFSDRDKQLLIERDGNHVRVTGNDGGVVIDRIIPIKAEKWYQILSFSLFDFSLSPVKQVSFALFDPYNIKVRSMRLDKKGVETIIVLGKEFQAEKLSMRMNGVLSVFWKSELWNSAVNGIHLQYEGLNIIPKFHKARIMLKSVEFIPDP